MCAFVYIYIYIRAQIYIYKHIRINLYMRVWCVYNTYPPNSYNTVTDY